MARTKKISYKPKVKQTLAIRTGLIAQQVELVRQADIERQVMKMVTRSKSYDEIAEQLHITTKEAHEIAKKHVARWLAEESLTAVEAREVMIRQLDSTIALCLQQAFPHTQRDQVGRPVMIRICDCKRDDKNTDTAKPCDIDSHNMEAITEPDVRWINMLNDLWKRKAELLGLNAAQRLEEQKVDIMKRMYVGVDAKDIDKL